MEGIEYLAAMGVAIFDLMAEVNTKFKEGVTNLD